MQVVCASRKKVSKNISNDTNIRFKIDEQIKAKFMLEKVIHSKNNESHQKWTPKWSPKPSSIIKKTNQKNDGNKEAPPNLVRRAAAPKKHI